MLTLHLPKPEYSLLYVNMFACYTDCVLLTISTVLPARTLAYRLTEEQYAEFLVHINVEAEPQIGVQIDWRKSGRIGIVYLSFEAPERISPGTYGFYSIRNPCAKPNAHH